MAVTRTQRRGKALIMLSRIREVARKHRHARFTSLMHHVTVDLLRESYNLLKRGAAPGVDGVTWAQYGTNLEERLADLHGRVHSGRYRAQPSKRDWIPKPGREEKRPLGIAALEDKIVQRAMVAILTQIYEEEFVGFSYGFRPERSAHNALDALWMAIVTRKVNWVLDTDLRSFFDGMSHQWVVRFLEQKVGDPRVIRLIRKWLRAGVSEDGEWSRTTKGVAQGSVISPILANIYLHYALDIWVQKWRRARARGEVYVVRYADDFALGFQYRADGERFLNEMRERLATYDLELHEGKTRLIEFGRFAARDRSKRGEGKPETFDFLGFTHMCATRRKDGRFTLRRKTIAKRMRAKVADVAQRLMRARHAPPSDVGRWLRTVVQGYYNYHAIPGNRDAIASFRTLVMRAWLRALRRRSQKARNLRWKQAKRLEARWLPKARILHPYPSQRFSSINPR